MPVKLSHLFAAALLVFAAAPAKAQYLRPTTDNPPGPPAEPGVLSAVLQAIGDAQLQLNRLLTETIHGADGQGLWPILAILGIAFAYGILHAVGPGHGKVVVTAYFAAHRARWPDALALGGLIATIQSAVAIAIVLVFAVILDVGRLALVRQIPMAELLSYGLIAVIGVGMLIAGLRGRSACGHDHGESHARQAPMPRNLMTLALGVGVRPCTGTILILLFTLSQGIILVGVLAALAVGLGVAITVGGFGLATIGSRRWLGARFAGRPGLAHQAERSVQIVGAAFITCAGALLFAAAWHRAAPLV